MTIKWNGNNYENFKKSFPCYIKTSTAGICNETSQIHIFTNMGIINCEVGQFLTFPPKESIKFYKSQL